MNCCRCLKDADDDVVEDDDGKNDDDDVIVRCVQTAKRLAGAHCKAERLTGRGSMQATPGRHASLAHLFLIPRAFQSLDKS